MNDLAKEIENAKNNIKKVLNGIFNKNSHPDYFQDDLFYFDLQLLEETDLLWLEKQLSKPHYASGTKKEILLNLSEENRRKLSGKTNMDSD